MKLCEKLPGKIEVRGCVLEIHHLTNSNCVCVFTSVSLLILGFQNVSVDISQCSFGVEKSGWQVGLPLTEE